MPRSIHLGIVCLLVSLLLYTRFVNLGWGLPYPMHPDERNMADAMTRIHCDHPLELLKGMVTIAPQNVVTFIQYGEAYLPKSNITCLNPDFFAYGQMSLYVGYILALLFGFFSSLIEGTMGNVGPWTISSQQAIIGLRAYSAIASFLIPFVAIRLLGRFHKDFHKPVLKYGAFLVFIFPPFLSNSHTLELLRLSSCYCTSLLLIPRYSHSRTPSTFGEILFTCRFT